MKIIFSDYDEKTQNEILEMYDNYQFLKSYDFDDLISFLDQISHDIIYQVYNKNDIKRFSNLENHVIKIDDNTQFELRFYKPVKFFNLISEIDDENYFDCFNIKSINNCEFGDLYYIARDECKKRYIKDYKEIIFNYIKEKNIIITKNIIDKLFISDISNCIYSYLI